MSNVVRQVYPGPGVGSIELSGRLTADGEVVVEIRDRGRWARPAVPAFDESILHGIPIMQAAMDEVLCAPGGPAPRSSSWIGDRLPFGLERDAEHPVDSRHSHDPGRSAF